MIKLFSIFVLFVIFISDGFCLNNNLTSFNGSFVELHGNDDNNLMNNHGAIDFGNCPAHVLRCASYKCGSSGCVSMELAYPIVSACVGSITECIKFGDPLIQFVSAQIVAKGNAKQQQIQEKQNENLQNNNAINDMKQQLESMQNAMAEQQKAINEQNNQTMANVQSQLSQIQQQVEQANIENTTKQAESVENNNISDKGNKYQGVSAEALAREEISGQINSKLENVSKSLQNLKKIMRNVFDYAGCNSLGDGCSAPKRVAVFKSKAIQFFDPYENTVEELYDAIVLAQTVGVDIQTIYMLLNDTCKTWGKFHKLGEKYQLIKVLTDKDEIMTELLEQDSNSNIVIKCASDSIETNSLFKSVKRRKSSNVDIDTLRMIIEQDDEDNSKYCAVSSELDINELKKFVKSKKSGKNLCAICDNDKCSKKTCSDDIEFANPMFAMCSTHIFNIGKHENDLKEIAKMNEVLELKTTYITQELQRQYKFLESTVKQFKTQLEKALLTTKFESLGAEDYKSNLGKNSINGIEECQNKNSTREVFLCLRNNFFILNSNISDNKMSRETKEQLYKDYNTMCMNGDLSVLEPLCKDDKCQNKNLININCLQNLNIGSRKMLEYEEDKRMKYKN